MQVYILTYYVGHYTRCIHFGLNNYISQVIMWRYFILGDDIVPINHLPFCLRRKRTVKAGQE